MGRIRANIESDENSTMKNELKKFMNLNCYREIKYDSIYLSDCSGNRTRYNYKKNKFFQGFFISFYFGCNKRRKFY